MSSKGGDKLSDQYNSKVLRNVPASNKGYIIIYELKMINVKGKDLKGQKETMECMYVTIIVSTVHQISPSKVCGRSVGLHMLILEGLWGLWDSIY